MIADRQVTGITGSSVSSGPALTQRDVEQQVRQFLDPSLPGFWLSDRVWSAFEDARMAGLSASFFLQVKIQLRKLARKYEPKPQEFSAAMVRVLKRRAGKLGFPWVADASSVASAAPTFKRLSSRKLQAFVDLMPLIRNLFFNASPPDLSVSERKQVAKFFSVMASDSPGRKRASTTEEILRIADDVRLRSLTLSLGDIATMAFPDYKQLDGDQRMMRRQTVSRVLKRHGFSSILSHHHQ